MGSVDVDKVILGVVVTLTDRVGVTLTVGVFGKVTLGWLTVVVGF